MEKRRAFVSTASLRLVKTACIGVLLVGWCHLADISAQAQIQYSNTIPAILPDNNCTAAGTTSRTFVVTENYTVGDVDLGALVTHTYRSDLRITLSSPAGTTVTVMTWAGNVQPGNNLNDLFDDEASAAITSHFANVTDPSTPVPPPYSHSFRPSSPLSVFNGQNANGIWTMTICDAVRFDRGIFNRADLFITPLPATINVTKISTVLNDRISVTNPKAVPGATLQYCIAIGNIGPGIATTINASDIIPANTSYIAGSMQSGASCGTAATPEDDNDIGSDESDPVGATISGTAMTISSTSLNASGAFALTYRVVID